MKINRLKFAWNKSSRKEWRFRREIVADNHQKIILQASLSPTYFWPLCTLLFLPYPLLFPGRHRHRVALTAALEELHNLPQTLTPHDRTADVKVILKTNDVDVDGWAQTFVTMVPVRSKFSSRGLDLAGADATVWRSVSANRVCLRCRCGRSSESSANQLWWACAYVHVSTGGGAAEEDNGWLTRGRVTNCRFTLCPYSISCLCVSRAEGGNGLMSIKGVNKWNYTEKYTHTHTTDTSVLVHCRHSQLSSSWLLYPENSTLIH